MSRASSPDSASPVTAEPDGQADLFGNLPENAAEPAATAVAEAPVASAAAEQAPAAVAAPEPAPALPSHDQPAAAPVAPNRADYALRGRRIVITGAAQGIGAACARLLAGQGARLALWDINITAAEALADELRASGADCHAVACNVADRASVDAALAATLAALGGLDGVVSNAGIFRAAPFLEVSEADWDAVVDTNLKGSFLVTQACAHAMVAAGTPGAIVLMSSVNGVMAIPEIASYNASKGGIDQLTRAAALALADHGIRVNAVAPGTIATELAAAAVLTSEAARLRILGRTPMKRLGEPQEIAEVVAFLLSSGARYMTGEIVYVDGGRRALNYSVNLDT
jgi:NAD(P)-dependent dehydrogenase (short-subunit alcohol dehydrogenase family)